MRGFVPGTVALGAEQRRGVPVRVDAAIAGHRHQRQRARIDTPVEDRQEGSSVAFDVHRPRSPGALQGQRHDPRIGRSVDERPCRCVAPRKARVFAAAGHEPPHQHEQRLCTQSPTDLGRERRFEAARVAATELLRRLRAVLVGVGPRVRGRDRRSPPTASVLRDRALPRTVVWANASARCRPGAFVDQQPRADFFDVARIHRDEAPVGSEGQPARPAGPVHDHRSGARPGDAVDHRPHLARGPAQEHAHAGQHRCARRRARHTRPRPPAAGRGTRGPGRRSRTGRPAPGRPRCTSPPRPCATGAGPRTVRPYRGPGRRGRRDARSPGAARRWRRGLLDWPPAASRHGRSRSRPPSPRPARAAARAPPGRCRGSTRAAPAAVAPGR